jgi:exodeoxyribonuclease-3
MPGGPVGGGAGPGAVTVATVNVNGIRAATRKGFGEWLAGCGADVVCLQETRATGAQVREALAAALDGGWRLAVAESAARGRNGVAVLSRAEPDAVRVGVGSDEFAAAGRYLEADFGALTVGSLYLPSGQVDTPRQAEKERFMAEFAAYLRRTRRRAREGGRDVLVCGDWNIAHTERDLKNWRGNRGNSGFLPGERQWIGAVLGEWVDVVRSLHPDAEGPYSWWSYRGKAFDNDAGWRIDYQVATPDLGRRAEEAWVERAPEYAARWSDHAPVLARYRADDR